MTVAFWQSPCFYPAHLQPVFHPDAWGSSPKNNLDNATPLFKTLQWLSHSATVKARAYKAWRVWAPAATSTSSLTHLSLPIFSSHTGLLLFLLQPSTPASGPLHTLICLSKLPFPRLLLQGSHFFRALLRQYLLSVSFLDHPYKTHSPPLHSPSFWFFPVALPPCGILSLYFLVCLFVSRH